VEVGEARRQFRLLALVEPIKLPNLVDFMRRCEL